MTEKYLRVTMEDGSKWDVPVKIIAESRARYYAEKETGEKNGEDFEKIFNEEVEYALDEDFDYDVIDWAGNNMNWSDVKDVAVKVSIMKVDFQEGWVNGDKEVVTKEVSET